MEGGDTVLLACGEVVHFCVIRLATKSSTEHFVPTMSVRTNPMKAIPLMLKRLRMSKITMPPDKSVDANLEELISQLEKIKDLFKIVKDNEMNSLTH
ncbi:hypothetical protein Fmac_027009 [Flemingia macrophylla]|uniref:Uncharacterized protein n=1 Tax=Flemingia macrophylla TaxID=520843 RepID=A0ABD1LGG1_9FABA